MGGSRKGFDPKNLDYLDQVNWAEIYPSVLRETHAHCFSRAAKLNLNPTEVLNEAVSRAYGAGTARYGESTYRNWNRERYPDIKEFLIGIVDSLISHQLTAAKKKGENEVNSYSLETTKAQELDIAINRQPPSTPEQEFLDREKGEVLDGFFKQLSANDKDEALIIKAYLDGLDDKLEIADKTGLSPHKVKNTIRRVRRKLRRLADKNPHWKGFLK